MIDKQTLPPWVTDPTGHPRWDGERIVPYSESVRGAPAVVGDGSPTGAIQVACDRCTQGVMDSTNPHLTGECECQCHAATCIECGESMGVETSTRNGRPCHVLCPRDYPAPVAEALRRLKGMARG